MHKDKGTVTEEEQLLISRYPENEHEKLKFIFQKSKVSHMHDLMIEGMEWGRELDYLVTDKGVTVFQIGKLNVCRFIMKAIEIECGYTMKPTEGNLNHDDRIEQFRQYPKGTRVKAVGQVIYNGGK